MNATIILNGFAILYYVFCVVFLCEDLSEKPYTVIETITLIIFILVIAPIIVPILLAIFLSKRYKKMME